MSNIVEICCAENCRNPVSTALSYIHCTTHAIEITRIMERQTTQPLAELEALRKEKKALRRHLAQMLATHRDDDLVLGGSVWIRRLCAWKDAYNFLKKANGGKS